MATPFLAKGVSNCGLGGCPDLRHFAAYSGGTVADSHGLPQLPNLINVAGSLRRRGKRVNQRKAGRAQIWLDSRAQNIPLIRLLCPVHIVNPPAAAYMNQREARAVIPVIVAVQK